jgi:hypothetical protein
LAGGWRIRGDAHKKWRGEKKMTYGIITALKMQKATFAEFLEKWMYTSEFLSTSVEKYLLFGQ